MVNKAPLATIKAMPLPGARELLRRCVVVLFRRGSYPRVRVGKAFASLSELPRKCAGWVLTSEFDIVTAGSIQLLAEQMVVR